jgi:hypothetical protein
MFSALTACRALIRSMAIFNPPTKSGPREYGFEKQVQICGIHVVVGQYPVFGEGGQ